MQQCTGPTYKNNYVKDVLGQNRLSKEYTDFYKQIILAPVAYV